MPIFYHSQCKMVLYNGQLATEYNLLPLINPDFIYLMDLINLTYATNYLVLLGALTICLCHVIS